MRFMSSGVVLGLLGVFAAVKTDDDRKSNTRKNIIIIIIIIISSSSSSSSHCCIPLLLLFLIQAFSAYQKQIFFLISQPKPLLWVLKNTSR